MRKRPSLISGMMLSGMIALPMLGVLILYIDFVFFYTVYKKCSK